MRVLLCKYVFQGHRVSPDFKSWNFIQTCLVPVSINDEQNFDSFSVKTMYTKNFKSSDTFEVFFTPENDLTTSIMEKTCDELRQSFITYDWTGRKKISKDFVARGFQNERILEVRKAKS